MNRTLRKILPGLVVVLHSAAAHASWPALTTVIERTRTGAPATVAAQGDFEVARAARAGAEVSWLANPYLELQGYRSSSTKDIAFQSFVAIPIEINGQRPSRIREADALASWKALAREDTRAEAIAYAVTVYGEALVARAKVDLAAKAEADARAEADLYDARLASGDVTVVDKSLADAEVARYAQQRAEATLAMMSACGELQIAMAVEEVGTPPSGSADPPALRAASADAFVALVLGTAPRLRSLASESSFWRAQSDRASRDKNLPFNFIVNFGRSDLGDFQFGGGLAWTFPITQRMQGPVAMAEAESRRADALRASTAGMLGARARHLYEQYDLLRSTLAALDQTGIPAQERVVAAMTAEYHAGKTDYVRVLQVRRDLTLARIRRLDLVMLAWRRYGEMTALTGELP